MNINIYKYLNLIKYIHNLTSLHNKYHKAYNNIKINFHPQKNIFNTSYPVLSQVSNFQKQIFFLNIFSNNITGNRLNKFRSSSSLPVSFIRNILKNRAIILSPTEIRRRRYPIKRDLYVSWGVEVLFTSSL